MTLKQHAESELNIIGMTEDSDDEMNIAMRKHILHIVDEFTKEGHSGFSASYAISIISKLLKYEPLTALTGEDSEWVEIADEISGSNRGKLYQNKRAGHVFKDDDGAYDSQGKVFVEWRQDKETGEDYSTSYTSIESRVPVTFPYIPHIDYINKGFVEE
jgi:hypothetical protein